MHYLIYLKRFFQTPESLTGSLYAILYNFIMRVFFQNMKNRILVTVLSSSYTQCGNTDPTDFSEIILALATFSYLANAVIHMNCQQIANYAYLVYKCSPT